MLLVFHDWLWVYLFHLSFATYAIYQPILLLYHPCSEFCLTYFLEWRFYFIRVQWLVPPPFMFGSMLTPFIKICCSSHRCQPPKVLTDLLTALLFFIIFGIQQHHWPKDILLGWERQSRELLEDVLGRMFKDEAGASEGNQLDVAKMVVKPRQIQSQILPNELSKGEAMIRQWHLMALSVCGRHVIN